MAKKKNRNKAVESSTGSGKRNVDHAPDSAVGDESPSSTTDTGGGSATSHKPQVKTELELPHGVTGVAWEPLSSHKGSVILLHGLGDDSSYWETYHESLKRCCSEADCVRWIVLDAPERRVWKERMSAWFQYRGPEKSGQDVEDDLNEEHLEEMRAAIHPLIVDEAAKLRAYGGIDRVLLIGSSQGGSMALHLGLTLPDGLLKRNRVGGVAMLRSLALSATVEAAQAKSGGFLSALSSITSTGRVPLLAVSGEDDETFIVSLVRRNLKAIEPFADVTHEVLSGLDHEMNYDPRETAHAMRFIVERLQLESQAAPSVAELTTSLASVAAHDCSHTKGCDKDWADLTPEELKWAQQLGIKGANAWDSGTAPVWSQYWRKLTPQQQQAAANLGFDQRKWDAD